MSRPNQARPEVVMTPSRFARLAAPGALVLLGLLAAPPVFAEGMTKVKGTVTDASGKPLEKVPIFFEATDIKKIVGPVKTDKNGKYLIATLDKSVAMKWKVYPKLEGYKTVIMYWTIVSSGGEELDKSEKLFDTKQEFPDFPLVLVGDNGKNQFDFVIAKDADFVAANQAIQKKRKETQAGGGAGPATAQAGAPAAAAPAAEGPKINAEAAQSLQQAKSLADAGNHPEAIQLYQAFLTKDPTSNPAVYYYLGKSLFETGDDAAAARAFSKGLELKPDMKGAHFYLGNLSLRQEDAPGAAAEYEKELALSPDSDTVLYNLGQAYMKSGAPDKAIAFLEKAAAITPEKPEPLMLLASAYEAKGDKAKADEIYQKVAAIDPRNAAILFYNVGVKAWNEKRGKDAAQAYQKAVEIDPQYAQAHRELGYALMAQQDFKGALAHFQEYLKLEPQARDMKEIQDSIALLKK
jgi:tetratricopeptide (TPR) repeat protein